LLPLKIVLFVLLPMILLCVIRVMIPYFSVYITSSIKRFTIVSVNVMAHNIRPLKKVFKARKITPRYDCVDGTNKQSLFKFKIILHFLKRKMRVFIKYMKIINFF
jgi:hypothetical protein